MGGARLAGEVAVVSIAAESDRISGAPAPDFRSGTEARQPEIRALFLLPGTTD